MRQVEASSDVSASSSKWPVTVAVVLAVLLVAAATQNISRITQTASGAEGRNTAAYARITQLAAVLVAATNAETCSHGFVTTGDAGFLAPYERALTVQDEAMSELVALYAGDRERGPLLRDVRDALARQREHMSGAVTRRRALGAGPAAALIAKFRGRELTDSVRASVSLLLADEQSGLTNERAVVKSASAAGTRKRLAWVGLGVLLGGVATVALLRGRRRSAQDVYAARLLPDLDGRYEP